MNFWPLKDLMERLTSWQIPGNSVSVCLDGNEIFSYQTGYADIETKELMTPDHFLYLYSASKVATVTAALQLYEKGYFLLDDPLCEFIPEYRDVTIRRSNGEVERAKRPITLRHLFAMTSGMDYNTHSAAMQKAHELTGGNMDTLTVARCLASEPLHFEPGSAWQYGLNHDVLAAVVEVISGMKFRDYMEKNIFAPLGIEAYYHDAGLYDRMAQQYRYVDGETIDIVALQQGGLPSVEGVVHCEGKSNSLILGSEYDSGGAGIITSVANYSKFAAALACKGLGANGERILSPGTVELLRQDQLTPELRAPFLWGQNRGYSYGLGVRTLISQAESGSTGTLGEFGWCGAAGACLIVQPDCGLSVCYAHHMLNPQEHIYMPRLRNVIYTCLNS